MMSRKAYEEIANLEPMEMTFTIEDADLDKLNDVLKDINVRECPWFEVQDKHGNKAKYYREPRWIPCSERLPEENGQYLITVKYEHVDDYEDIYSEHGEWVDGKWDMFLFGHCGKVENIIAWMPLPSPYEP